MYNFMFKLVCLSKPVHLPCIVDFQVFGHIHLVHVLTYKVEELHLPCMLLLSGKKQQRNLILTSIQKENNE